MRYMRQAEIITPQAKINVLCSAHPFNKKKRADLCGHTESTLEPQPYLERMKLMTTHGSATSREETPHEIETPNGISDAVRHRAQLIIDDTSIDPEWRAVICYGLKTNDSLLPDLVQRAEAGEQIIDTIDFSQTSEADDDESEAEKIEALTEIICRAGGETVAALFVLMRRFQNSKQPEVLANAAKHHAFTRCGELNVFGMVDAQISAVEGELLAGRSAAR